MRAARVSECAPFDRSRVAFTPGAYSQPRPRKNASSGALKRLAARAIDASPEALLVTVRLPVLAQEPEPLELPDELPDAVELPEPLDSDELAALLDAVLEPPPPADAPVSVLVQ